MAQIDVQNILQAYTSGAQLAAQRRQLDLEQQRVNQDATRIANEHQYQMALAGSTELERQTQAAQIAQQMAQLAQQGGPLPANSTLTPEVQSLPGNTQFPINVPTGRNKLSFPLGNQKFDFETLNPEDYAQQQGRLGLLSQASVLEKQRQLQEEMAQRELARENVIQEREDRRNLITRTTQLEEARIKDATERARIAAEYGDTNFDPQPYIGPAAIGRYSQKDIQSMPGLPVGNKRAIDKAMNVLGYKYLNDKDQEFLNNATGAVSVLPMMDQYNKMYDSMLAIDLINPLKNQELRKLGNAIHENIVRSSQLIGNSGRNTNMLVNALGGAYDVTAIPAHGSANKAAAANFAKAIYGVMEDRLAGLSEGQRALIYNDRGLGLGTNATVKMKFPNGQVYDVQLGDEMEALKRGGKRVTISNAK